MLVAFTAGLLLITVSELGDKTFFIAMILAMRHSKRLVMVGVVSALAAMTILSVLMGRAVSFLPAVYIHYAEVALFLVFGVKLLYEASRMPAECKVTGSSDPTCISEGEQEAVAAVKQAEANLKHKTPLAIVTEAFMLTFVAEWGDRTQIATIALAASNNPIGVTLGAILGHTICALIAVLGGYLVAGRISERTIVTLGGVLFLIFGAIAWWEGV
jgi:Ca2+/H+ antiporter, TMEM165/GDT1 family